MKKKISLLVFFAAAFLINDASAQQTNAPFLTYEPYYSTVIDNGNYKANVRYSSSTGQRNNYQLTVTVKNDAVVAIYFGNNGSVHSGYNNEGYTYSGGSLSFQKDYNGNVVSATTTVVVRNSNGTTQQFAISL